MKKLKLLCMLASLLILLGGAAQSEAAKPIVVLYKSSENSTADHNVFAYHLHAYAESEGYEVRYHDIDSSFPSDEKMKEVYAIITAYNGPIMQKARAYIDWLSQQVLNYKKVLILGNFGAFSPDGDTWFDGTVLNKFYYLLGLDFSGQWTNDPNIIETAFKESDMVEFETTITSDVLHHYFLIRSLRPENQAYLTLKRRDMEDSESVVVVKTPVGGLAMENYVFTQVQGTTKKLLNLEQFFRACLQNPIPKGVIPEKRVLALYKTEEDQSPENTLISRFLMKDLILLGYWPEYLDVDRGAPDDKDMQPYHAVITWFQSPYMYDAEDYCDWLLTQIREGRKAIILGNFGAFAGIHTKEALQLEWWVNNTGINHFLYNFGIEFLGNWTGNPDMLVVKAKTADMVEHERALTHENLRHYYHWRSVYPENTIYLQVARTDLPDAESAFIVRTPFGGFAFESYIYHSDPETWKISFFLNRRQFLKDCLEYTTSRKIAPVQLIPHHEIFAELKQEPLAQLPPGSRETIRVSEPNEVKRKILGLYKRSPAYHGFTDVHDFTELDLAKVVEPVLNYLGFYLDFHAIESGLPGDDIMQQYHGIITSFDSAEMSDPDAYLAWLRHQIAQQRKIVILGDIGAWAYSSTFTPYRRAAQIFELMGAKVYDTEITNSDRQEIVYIDPEMMNYERPLDLDETEKIWYKVVSADPANKVILRLKDKNLGTIEPIMITKTGALALGDYILYSSDVKKELEAKIRQILAGDRNVVIPEIEYQSYWRINPFLFFKAAFAVEGVPAPDVTTLNGYRIFYTHIDGDGFKGISLIDQSGYSGKWVLEEIFKQYDLPITASIITTEIEDEPSSYYNRPYKLAREMFALENVEPASHTYKHPFKWRTADLSIRLKPDSYEVKSIPIEYLEQTEGSLRFIESNLLPPHKKANVLLWSGDCHPDERALSILDRYNRLNMNAGDPIYDEERDSITGLAAIGVSYSGYRQIFTSGLNDYLYTAGWTQNFGGMRELVSHFTHTESPKRLSPLNIYYHFYIGDRQEGLDGLKEAYDYCYQRQIAPMFVSQYIQVAHDFYQTRLFQLPDGTWEIRDNGKLRTLRFDNDARYPDFEASSGVIGFGRVNDDLYVYLDNQPVHRLKLTETPPQTVYFAGGSHYIDDVTLSPEYIAFTSYGYGQAAFLLHNLRPGDQYDVTVTPDDAAQSHTKPLTVDQQGMLMVQHPFLRYTGQYQITITKKKVS